MGRIGSFEKTVEEKVSTVDMGHTTDEWQNGNGVVVGVHCMDNLSGATYSYELHVEIGEDEFGGPDEELFQGASDKVTRMRGEAADVMRDISSGNLIDVSEEETTVQTTPTETGSVNPATSGGTNGKWEQKIRDYLKEWYPKVTGQTVEVYGQTYTFEIDWSNVEIIVSGRLSRASGRARWHTDSSGKTEYELKVSKHLIKNQDWDRVRQTVRHEAIHIWQYQTESFSGGHGVDFRKWMNKDDFDCTVNAERPAADPKYEAICDDCGTIAATRQRKCKLTKKTYLYNCAGCGGNLTVNKLR